MIYYDTAVEWAVMSFDFNKSFFFFIFILKFSVLISRKKNSETHETEVMLNFFYIMHDTS